MLHFGQVQGPHQMLQMLLYMMLFMHKMYLQCAFTLDIWLLTCIKRESEINSSEFNTSMWLWAALCFIFSFQVALTK